MDIFSHIEYLWIWVFRVSQHSFSEFNSWNSGKQFRVSCIYSTSILDLFEMVGIKNKNIPQMVLQNGDRPHGRIRTTSPTKH